MGLHHVFTNRLVNNRSLRSRRLMLGVVGVMMLLGYAVPTRAENEVGYLKSAGPAPLRFRTPVAEPSAVNVPEIHSAVVPPINTVGHSTSAVTNKPAALATHPASNSTGTN